MAETAALLADEVLPKCPLRQWVLSLPYALRFMLATDPDSLTLVLGTAYRAISGFPLTRAGLTRATGSAGAVTLVQRFGSSLNLNIHFHMIVPDGVYLPVAGTAPVFRVNSFCPALGRTAIREVIAWPSNNRILETHRSAFEPPVFVVKIGGSAMSMGLVLVLVVAGVAGYFLAERLGWLGFFSTLCNRGRSRFRRSESDGQTIFKVTPARPSLAALAAIVLGVVLLKNVETLEVIAYFGLIPLIMGVMAFAIGARYRRPVTIIVAEGEIRSGNKSWALEDLADFNVRRGSRIKTDEPAPVIHRTAAGGPVYGGKPTSLMFSRALNRRAVERSYLVTLRTRTGSHEAVLGGGLTIECADSLRHDLRDAVASAKASIGGVAAA